MGRGVWLGVSGPGCWGGGEGRVSGQGCWDCLVWGVGRWGCLVTPGGDVLTDGIVKYMKGKAGPVSKKLLTVADAEKFLSNAQHSIVGQSAVHTALM